MNAAPWLSTWSPRIEPGTSNSLSSVIRVGGAEPHYILLAQRRYEWRDGDPSKGTGHTLTPDSAGDDDVRLAAAAPALVRALLAVELAGPCPACEHPRESDPKYPAHYAGCLLDTALTLAGLDTQEKRDAARKAMAP